MFWISPCLLCVRAGSRGAGSVESLRRERQEGTAERDKSILKTACVKQIVGAATPKAASDGAFATVGETL